MKSAVRVQHLDKMFRVRQKQPGLAGAVGSLFRPRVHAIHALDDVSFEIDAGDIVAFIGPNGAGKSTAIKAMTGILHPDGGTVRVLGRDPHCGRRELARRIGTVFGQKSQLWFHLPPRDSFLLLGTIYDLSRSETRGRIAWLTELFEIGEIMDQPVRKLSLGQRIRCEIAASLIHRPEILFLDEPSIGLDVVSKQRVRDLIARMNNEEGVTVFLTSHDAGDIERICRRAIMINRGRIVWDGTVKEMKYSILRKRVIDVRTERPVEVALAGVTVVKQREYAVKLEVDPDQVTIETVIAHLMGQTAIHDITVSSIPMEEIIAHMYRRRGETDEDAIPGGPS